ncbi:MAG: hypothetical protein PHQ05_12105 [Sterolibacterium sp.]|nr:hypothetical protein [Sterolibacterium sp.]
MPQPRNRNPDNRPLTLNMLYMNLLITKRFAHEAEAWPWRRWQKI